MSQSSDLLHEQPNMSDADKLKAAMDFLRSIGAEHVRLRVSNDEEPEIWIVVAEYKGKNRLHIRGTHVEASLDATRAAIRLCERLVDGSYCVHCEKRVAIEAELLAKMPFDHMICWYQYDPEMKVFRRSCE